MDSYLGNNNDPLSLNLYTYSYNNPVFYVDPNGHEAVAALYIWLTSVLSSPDTQMDIDMIAYDVSQGDYISAGLDAIGVLVPGGTGFGQGTKAARKGMWNKLKKGFSGIKKWFGFSDEVADGAKHVKNVIEVTAEVYSDYALKATKNTRANKVVLGKFWKNNVSYVDIAKREGATFFQLDEWNNVAKTIGDSNMWNINKEFLNQQWKAGKEIYFSHNPWEADGFLAQEVLHLIDLGVKDFIKEGDLWKAVK